jgi:hypothetical protein
MHQQLWGYKVEEKLYVGVRVQKCLNTTALRHHFPYTSTSPKLPLPLHFHVMAVSQLQAAATLQKRHIPASFSTIVTELYQLPHI